MTGEAGATTAAAIAAPAQGIGVGRIVLASLIGTAIEFYDFYIYGTAAALVIGQTFFPAIGAADPGAQRLPDLRNRLPGAAGRRVPVRPFRRPRRPQGDAGRDDGGHGPVDDPDRVAARLFHGRRARAVASVPAALRPGRRARRRMGRSGAAGDRERPARAARLVRHVPATRAADRFPYGQRPVPAADPRPGRTELHRLGVARPVPAQRRAGGDRTLRPRDRRRDAGLPRAGRSAPARSKFRSSKQFAIIGGR